MAPTDLFPFLMIITFCMGYALITVEHVSHINKSAIALLMAVICWIIQFANPNFSIENNVHSLNEHLSDIAQIIFFLLGALSIVEMMSAHDGFQVISNYLQINSKKRLLWIMGFVAFFLSAILDNLTTTIILVSLLQKMLKEGEERLVFGGAVVVAANAGGAWTPIGDVTTTMLWIGGQVSTLEIMRDLIIPSLVCLIAFLACLTFVLKGEFKFEKSIISNSPEPKGKLIFWLGTACLISVPLLKITLGLAPFMGMLLGLGIMWLVTDLLYKNDLEKQHLRVPSVLPSIDISGVLFFLGILLCIESLHTAGLLMQLAQWLDQTLNNPDLIAIAIGLGSAVVDNVPLVAAVMGMYDLSQYPMDSNFWDLIAYCAGTGGSILVIGSAAGVAYMGLEKVQFFWYLRRIGIPASVGYFSGIAIFKLMQYM